MTKYDALSKRMKDNYEFPYKYRLTRRMPVIIRVDGKAFHSFTRGFERPFDHVLMESMQKTMLDLCGNIQGAAFGYTQSDEISLLLIDYANFDTEAWFDNEVQKICSVSASMATLFFNKHFAGTVRQYDAEHEDEGWESPVQKRRHIALEKGALFDSRCFNVPREEVTNYFLSRQNDATRNSIQMVGQCYFSTKELHERSCNDIQDMLFTKKDINWNDFSVPEKRGTACIRTDKGWQIDTDMPVLKGEGRDYIERLLNLDIQVDLAMMDEAVRNLRAGKVSDPIDLSSFTQ